MCENNTDVIQPFILNADPKHLTLIKVGGIFIILCRKIANSLQPNNLLTWD